MSQSTQLNVDRNTQNIQRMADELKHRCLCDDSYFDNLMDTYVSELYTDNEITQWLNEEIENGALCAEEESAEEA